MNRFFAALRYTTAVALVGSAFVFSGCGDDDKGPTVFDGNILAFLKSDQNKQSVNNDATISFDSLVLYLDKYPELETNLTGTADFTLFAPSNAAFVNLTALPGLKDPDQINPDIIKGVLQYHFVQGKKMQSDLTAGTSITTLYVGAAGAEAIVVNGDGTLLTGSSNKNIQIVKADQLATNGVVHTTATVLIPNSTGGQLSAILGTLASTVLLGKDFTYMAYLIGRADANVATASKFSSTLAAGSNLTLLGIPNAVFVGAYNTATASSPTNVPTAEQVKGFIDNFGTGGDSNAMKILKNHLLAARYTVAASTGAGVTQFANGKINAVSTKEITVTTGLSAAQCSCTTGVLLSAAKTGGVANAPIVKADIDTEAAISNGVLQVVGGIFLP